VDVLEPSATTDVGFATTVDVLALTAPAFTVTPEVPALAAQLLFDLLYVAVIVAAPLFVAVKLVLQLDVLPLMVRVQDNGLKVPSAGEIVHAMSPCGGPLVDADSVFAMVAEQVADVPAVIDGDTNLTLDESL